MSSLAAQAIATESNNLEKQFAYVDSIINRHYTAAVANVNLESLLTAWEVGQYVSVSEIVQLATAQIEDTNG